MSNQTPLTISNETRQEILAYLQHHLAGGSSGDIFFRRVSRVVAKNPISITKNTLPNAAPEVLRNLKGVSKSDLERYVQVDYRSFFGFTQARPIRDEPSEFDNLEIFFHSDDFAQMDTTLDFTFEFSDDKRLTKPTTPVVGDLLCIYMSNETTEEAAKSNKNPRADKWFIASEQFLRAWTAIMYEWHDSFDHLIAQDTPHDSREAALRSKLFSGNRLMTNAWLKRKLALGANGDTMSETESAELYWHLRTEYASKRWVDTWACVVLVARYGELPCPANIPNNLGDGPQRVAWDLPAEFVTMLITRCTRGASFSKVNIGNYYEWQRHSRSRSLLSRSTKGRVNMGFLDDIARARADRIDSEIAVSKNRAEAKREVGVDTSASANRFNFKRGVSMLEKAAPPILVADVAEFPALPTRPKVSAPRATNSWAKVASAPQEPKPNAPQEPKPVSTPVPATPEPKNPTHIFKATMPIPTTQKTISISLEFEIPAEMNGVSWADMCDDDSPWAEPDEHSCGSEY